MAFLEGAMRVLRGLYSLGEGGSESKRLAFSKTVNSHKIVQFTFLFHTLCVFKLKIKHCFKL